MRGADLDTFGVPLDYPYLLGACLAVNAVKGAALLVDGPDCAVGKAEHVILHDRTSDLLDCAGGSRVACTWTDVRNAALSREEAVARGLQVLAQRRNVSTVLLSALPLAIITGTDYPAMLRKLGPGMGKPLLLVPPRSLQAGYLEGYAAVLEALAAGLDVSAADAGNVLVAGMFKDRNEEDRAADEREIVRMLHAVGLEPAAVWPGHSVRAGAVISMPYGRGAARVLAQRLHARRIDAGLPVGLAGTAAWLRAVAGKGAERFIQEETLRVRRGIERAGRLLRGKKVFASADPHLLDALIPALQELGLRVAGSASVGLGPKARGRLVRPTSGKLSAALKGVDLVIGNSDVCRLAPCRTLELGFPSRRWHALAPSPLLGFEGCLCLIDRIAATVQRA